MSEEKTPSFFEKLTPILFVFCIVLAAGFGFLWKKVDNLESGGAASATTTESLGVKSLKKYAKELKLNTKNFNKCLDEGQLEAKVKEELAEGEALGVTGTPAFFINGMLLGEAYPYESFKAVLDFELKGGDWKKPDAAIKTLVDGDETNGEIVTERKEVSVGDAPVLGDSSAPIKIVEYSDFECPYCARFHQETFPQINDNYIKTGKVLFSYKEYPLTFHASAQKAAEAVLCAKEQGKFWEMHDKLFTDSASIQ